MYFLPARSFLRFCPPLFYFPFSLTLFNHISPSLRRYACTYTIVRKTQVGRIGCSVSHLRRSRFLLYFLSPFFSFLMPFRSLRREQVHSFSRSSSFLRVSLRLLSVLCATLTATVSFFLVVAVLFIPLPSSHERLTSHDDCHLSRSIARRRAASQTPLNSFATLAAWIVVPHRGQAILPTSKRPDLFRPIRSPLLIPFLRNQRFLPRPTPLLFLSKEL